MTHVDPSPASQPIFNITLSPDRCIPGVRLMKNLCSCCLRLNATISDSHSTAWSIISLEQLDDWRHLILLCDFRFRAYSKGHLQIFFTLTCCRAHLNRNQQCTELAIIILSNICAQAAWLFSKVLTPSSSASESGLKNPFASSFSEADARLDSRCDLSIINFFPLERAAKHHQTNFPLVGAHSRRLYVLHLIAAKLQKPNGENTKRMGIFTESVSK